jgi:hypothetical protein
MRLDDLVDVESHANLDVPCASSGSTDQLKGFRMKNFQFSVILRQADRIRDSPLERNSRTMWYKSLT